QLEPLQTFGSFIQRLQARAGGRPGAAILPTQANLILEHGLDTQASGVDGAREDTAARQLDDLLNTIQYERHLYDVFDDRQAQSRWANVLELTSWLKRKAEEDGMTLIELVQHVA